MINGDIINHHHTSTTIHRYPPTPILILPPTSNTYPCRRNLSSHSCSFCCFLHSSSYFREITPGLPAGSSASGLFFSVIRQFFIYTGRTRLFLKNDINSPVPATRNAGTYMLSMGSSSGSFSGSSLCLSTQDGSGGHPSFPSG